ncbi:AI-2E family transporter [Nodosilinea sp. LEGE 07298]|uniref:AI-2E family transporter n=1 Tax=Nodosilinea sp. LEGE 07298 TaxID=2777970 RepID=UPI00188201C5|nr:AI-2E family transporter [Nodosilinea sp. LEGE 07298]MBE9108914.1 AI-2E family transporter [Nodosilinea sp. LEGE 07298]
MRLGKWVGLLALGVAIYLLWEIRQVLLLLFAAVVIATVLNRMVRVLRRGGIKRGFAIAITIALLMLIVFGLFAIILPRFIDQLQNLSGLLPAAIERLGTIYDWFQSRIPGMALGENQGVDRLFDQAQALISSTVGNFFTILNSSINVVVNLFLVLAATIMLLVNPGSYRRTFITAFPAFYRDRVHDILNQCEHSLVGWFQGTLAGMVTIGTLSYIGLLILGVPLPLVNAILAGLLEIIPNIGPVISAVPPILLGLLDAPWKGFAVLILYFLIQQFESLALMPILMKQTVSLMPLFTLLSVVIFAALFGFLGLFLAVPLLIVVQIWLQEVLIKDVMDTWQAPSSPPHRDQVQPRSAGFNDSAP